MPERGALERPAEQQARLALLEAAPLHHALPPTPADPDQSRAGRRRTRPLRRPADRLGHLHGHGDVRRHGAGSPRAAPVPAELVPLAFAGAAETLALPQLRLRAALHGRRHAAAPAHLLQPAAHPPQRAAARQQQDPAPPAQPGRAPRQQRHAPAAAERDEHLQRDLVMPGPRRQACPV